MNKAVLVGRLTRDPEVRYSQGDNTTAVARYTVAVDRRFKRDGEPTADFIPCVVFGRSAEFAEKYFRQGMRVSVSGRIQTGSYTNKDGMKVYTTEVIVEEQEFAESRAESEACLLYTSENHGGRTYIGDHTPFGKVFYGLGNTGKSGYEGVIYKNVIATYLHGPLLPKNPQVCDYLLEKALQRKYGEEVKLEPLKDETEKKANSYIADRYSDKKYVLRETVKRHT